MTTGIGLAVLAILGTAFGALSEVIEIAAGGGPERALIDFVVGEAYLVGGLFAWRRDRGNATWPVMAGTGVGWFVGNYAVAANSSLSTAATVFADTDAALLITLVLIYPQGHLAGWLHRAVVVIAAVGLTATNAIYAVSGAAAPNLVLGLTLTAALAILVPRRVLQARSVDRALLTPAAFATLVTLAAIGTAIVVQLLNVPEPARRALLAGRDIAVLAIPIGFILGSFQLADDRVRRSRARIVEAGDDERRRIERNLHDGAQQRLVTMSLALRSARRQLSHSGDPEVARAIDAASEELKAAITELRELARGIHPAVLAEAGLAGALPSLADRSAVPTTVTNVPTARFAPAVEATAYFVASEALANTAKHARATRAWIAAEIRDGVLAVTATDDGRGGADAAGGTGLRGLADRVAALGGTLHVESQPDIGTAVTAFIPLDGMHAPS